MSMGIARHLRAVAQICASVIIALLLSGCASLTPAPNEWSDKEKVAFGLSVVAHSVDAGSTTAADWDKCSEVNPIIGSAPSDASVIAFKLAVIGFGYWVHNSPSVDNTAAARLSFASAILTGAVGIHNLQQDCF